MSNDAARICERKNPRRSLGSAGRAAIFAVLASLTGCTEDIGEKFDQIEDEAPGVCKDFCLGAVECWWESGGDVEGAAAVSAYNDEISACIIDCAYAFTEGGYVAEVDSDGDIDLKRKISGSTYQAYFECLWDSARFYTCGDSGLSMDDDKGACDVADECTRILDIDLEYDWNGDAEYCEVSGDEFLYMI